MGLEVYLKFMILEHDTAMLCAGRDQRVRPRLRHALRVTRKHATGSPRSRGGRLWLCLKIDVLTWTDKIKQTNTQM